MKNINKAALFISKAAEIMHWLCVFMVVIVFAASFFTDFAGIGESLEQLSLSTYGFELEIANQNGGFDVRALRLFSVAALVLLSLMAMVFRNVYLIIKKTSSTPFQKDVVRMFREIGYFFIAIPVWGIVMSIVSKCVLGWNVAETSVSFEGIIIGILFFCLSGAFAYGKELQDDVDGLL